MKIPKFHFHYANLLEPYAHFPVPPKEELKEKINAQISYWREHGDVIVAALCELLGLEFKNTELDVHFAFLDRSTSIPLIINARHSPEVFSDILTHELIHRLIVDNSDRWLPTKSLNEKYKDEEMFTRIHIPVFAILEYIFREVWQDEKRLERDKHRAQLNPQETRAYGIVEKTGYKDIIAMLDRKTRS